MIEYRIYTKPKGKRKATQRLEATTYREEDAKAIAGRFALWGSWVTITMTPVAEPDRFA